jgi:hypothetical protein
VVPATNYGAWEWPEWGDMATQNGSAQSGEWSRKSNARSTSKHGIGRVMQSTLDWHGNAQNGNGQGNAEWQCTGGWTGACTASATAQSASANAQSTSEGHGNGQNGNGHGSAQTDSAQSRAGRAQSAAAQSAATQAAAQSAAAQSSGSHKRRLVPATDSAQSATALLYNLLPHDAQMTALAY